MSESCQRGSQRKSDDIRWKCTYSGSGYSLDRPVREKLRKYTAMIVFEDEYDTLVTVYFEPGTRYFGSEHVIEASAMAVATYLEEGQTSHLENPGSKAGHNTKQSHQLRTEFYPSLTRETIPEKTGTQWVRTTRREGTRVAREARRMAARPKEPNPSTSATFWYAPIMARDMIEI